MANYHIIATACDIPQENEIAAVSVDNNHRKTARVDFNPDVEIAAVSIGIKPKA